MSDKYVHMGIEVPHRDFGDCSWFAPDPIRDWLSKFKLRYTYTGGHSSGDGYTDGVTNAHSTYNIRDAVKSDVIAFKIIFPTCKVHCYDPEGVEE